MSMPGTVTLHGAGGAPTGLMPAGEPAPAGVDIGGAAAGAP